MKKITFSLRHHGLMMLAFMGLLSWTSCTDYPDRPVTPDDPAEVVDPVTEEAYENQDLMDRSADPGDSFYEFALGTWLNTHDKEDEGLMNSASMQIMRTCAMGFMFTSDPLVSRITDIAQHTNKSAEAEAILNIDPTLSAAYLAISSVGDDDDELIDITTHDQVVQMLASLIKKGYSPLVKSTIFPMGGRYLKAVTAGDINSDVKEALQMGDEDAALEAVKKVAARMVDDDEDEVDEDDLDTFAALLLDIDQQVFNASNDNYSDDLTVRAKAKPTATLKPSQARMRTRAASSSLFALLGIDDENSIVDDQLTPILNLIDTEDPDNLVVYLMYCLLSENLDLVDGAEDPGDLDDDDDDDDFDWGSLARLKNAADDEDEDDDDDDDDEGNLLLTVYQKLMNAAPEVISSIDYKFLSDEKDFDAEGCREMMEQMRDLMDRRISNLAWMSDATKSAARQKLAAMEFYIGVPETRPGQNLTLTFGSDEKETAVGAVQQLRQQRYEALMKLADDNVPVKGHGWDMAIQLMTLNTCNAFYSANLNQLFILPTFLGNKLFPRDNEVMRYATAMVFGHEMCHGFDTNGSQFDAIGNQVNWWAQADKTAFTERANKMVELYNQLMQFGNVHADGKMTLDENIADLGGVTLAFGLYQEQLANEGLSAQQIRHQLREFFLHFALLWQEDPSQEELYQALLTDEHSAAHNRVNGTTRLLDEWYDLFNVTGGDLYLAPADRVTIW